MTRKEPIVNYDRKERVTLIDECVSLCGTADEIREMLNDFEKEAVQRFGDQFICIRVEDEYYGYDGGRNTEIYAVRWETDFEMKGRIDGEERHKRSWVAQQEKNEKKERELYRKLHRKYGKEK